MCHRTWIVQRDSAKTTHKHSYYIITFFLCACWFLLIYCSKWLERRSRLSVNLMYVIILVCGFEGRMSCLIWTRRLQYRSSCNLILHSDKRMRALSHVVVCKAGVSNYFWQRATQLLLWLGPWAARLKSQPVVHLIAFAAGWTSLLSGKKDEAYSIVKNWAYRG